MRSAWVSSRKARSNWFRLWRILVAITPPHRIGIGSRLTRSRDRVRHPLLTGRPETCPSLAGTPRETRELVRVGDVRRDRQRARVAAGDEFAVHEPAVGVDVGKQAPVAVALLGVGAQRDRPVG